MMWVLAKEGRSWEQLMAVLMLNDANKASKASDQIVLFTSDHQVESAIAKARGQRCEEDSNQDHGH